MKRVIEFIKKRYKFLIPIMVLLVLLMAFYFLYKENQYDNKRDKKEVSVFQYFGGERTDYTAIITYNLKKVIVDIEAKDEKINYTSNPVYFKDENKVLFPSEMGIVFPIKNGSQFKLYKYALYEYKDEVNYVTNGNNTFKDNYFFIYDGKELYFFQDKVTIMLDGQEYMHLSPMSYVKYVGGYTLTYYDRESDTAKVVDVTGKKVNIVHDDYDIYLNERTLIVSGDKIALVEPEYLNAAK